MRILVTGSEGLIGRQLVSRLKQLDICVSTLDLLNSTQSETHHQGDVRDYNMIKDAVRGVDGVVHLAAISRVRWGFEYPRLCMNVNVQGTLNILEAIRNMNRPPWLVFGSSREVYGNPLKLPVKEDAEYSPTNVYAVSKVSGELLCKSYNQNYGISCIVLRFSNVYGSEMDHSDRVVPRFILSAMTGTPLRLFGGRHTFDFVHLDDAVVGIHRAICLLEESGDQLYESFHLVTGIPTSLEDLASLVVDSSESSSKINLEPPEAYFPSHFYGDTTKARSLLKFEAKTSIEKGIIRLISEYKRYLERNPDALPNLAISEPPLWFRQLKGSENE
ncbi:MAG: NAD-dependent epimerase/dehydratase family protein [Candidatus Thorarchaeota archaeon]